MRIQLIACHFALTLAWSSFWVVTGRVVLTEPDTFPQRIATRPQHRRLASGHDSDCIFSLPARKHGAHKATDVFEDWCLFTIIFLFGMPARREPPIFTQSDHCTKTGNVANCIGKLRLQNQAIDVRPWNHSPSRGSQSPAAGVEIYSGNKINVSQAC